MVRDHYRKLKYEIIEMSLLVERNMLVAKHFQLNIIETYYPPII